MVNMITNMNPFYLDSYADSYAVKFKHHFVCIKHEIMPCKESL